MCRGGVGGRKDQTYTYVKTAQADGVFILGTLLSLPPSEIPSFGRGKHREVVLPRPLGSFLVFFHPSINALIHPWELLCRLSMPGLDFLSWKSPTKGCAPDRWRLFLPEVAPGTFSP